MSLPHKVALAVTSYNGPLYPDGKNTGAFYTEVLHPFLAFAESGFAVDVVSETGTFGWDEHSLSDDFSTKEEREQSEKGPFADAIRDVKKASAVQASDYGIIFAAGGHGTVFDFVDKAPGLFKLASDIWAKTGIVAAVCHGPCLLSGIKDGSHFIAAGRKVTGFPDSGEEAMQLVDTLESKHLAYTEKLLKNLGGIYEPVDPPFGPKTVVDGRLVTGANPASAGPTAEAAIKVFSQ